MEKDLSKGNMKRLHHMRASRLRICTLAVLLLFVTGSTTLSQQRTHKSSSTYEPINVGMVSLLASPERYDGQRIRTAGFLCLEFEGNAIYLHEEDYRFELTKNAFSLDLTKEQEVQFKPLSLKYVLIEGTVEASKASAEKGIYSGHIGNITRLQSWRPRGDIPAPLPEPHSKCSP